MSSLRRQIFLTLEGARKRALHESAMARAEGNAWRYRPVQVETGWHVECYKPVKLADLEP